MNMYEFNQISYSSVPDMTEEELDKAKKNLRTFLQNNIADYYLLLNNEAHYYTVFNYVNTLKIKEMTETIMEIVLELGSIKAIEIEDDKVEFWIMHENECKVFYLFDYTQGVIRV